MSREKVIGYCLWGVCIALTTAWLAMNGRGPLAVAFLLGGIGFAGLIWYTRDHRAWWGTRRGGTA